MRFARTLRPSVAVAAMLAVSPAAATGQAPEATAPVAEALAAAIGRLNHAGYRQRRHCTAFLLAPREIATARHCIRGVDPAEMHFLTGYDRMHWREHLRPVAVLPPETGRDVVRLCLDGSSTAAPLPVASGRVAVGEEVIVLGYGAPAVQRLNRTACAVRAVEGAGAMLLDCGLTPGASGAPVLRADADGTLAVVGLVSRSGRNASIAEAVPADRAAGACPD